MSTPKNLLGYKIFKKDLGEDDPIELFRIIEIINDPNKEVQFKVQSTYSGESKMLTEASMKNYKYLEPDGYLTFSTVSVEDENGVESEDVIVTCSKVLEMMVGMSFPYAICRQSVNDIYADMMGPATINTITGEKTNELVGLSINVDDCPGGFDIGLMLACKEIMHSVGFHFYRNDTLDQILEFIDLRPFDFVLEKLYKVHCKYSSNPTATLQDEDMGWCRNLKTLLKINNFESDMNQMLGITDVDFDVMAYTVEKPLPDESKGTYTSADEELTLWLSGTFRVAINDTTIIEYDHDINLGEFNNSRYLFLRDPDNKLYFIVYTINNEVPLSDLVEEYNKKDFSEELRIKFYNKYNFQDNV